MDLDSCFIAEVVSSSYVGCISEIRFRITAGDLIEIDRRYSYEENMDRHNFKKN